MTLDDGTVLGEDRCRSWRRADEIRPGDDTQFGPVSLTDDQQHSFVSSVNYNPASQITQISAPDYSTSYQYNERNQLVGIGSSTGFGETYAFSLTQNNGQIVSQTNTRTGETVSYRYDALGRLANAAATASSVGAAWAMSFGYDGFGNRYSQNMTAGTGPTVNLGFDANNHINYPAGYSYDGNGNMTSVPGASGPVQYDYDYDNRLKGYTYGIDGKRLVKVTPFESSQPGPKVGLEVYFYGPGGQIQGIYNYGPYRTYSSDGYPRDWAFSVSRKESRVYFAGRWVGGVNVNSGLIYRVAEDRLGSVRATGFFNSNTGNLQSGFSGYFPYGEQRYGGGANFATYTRDGETGLDYAQQRQYGSAHGVFTTADPSLENASVFSSTSWNSYTYANGEPNNQNDPSGTGDPTYGYCLTHPWICDPFSSDFGFIGNPQGGLGRGTWDTATGGIIPFIPWIWPLFPQGGGAGSKPLPPAPDCTVRLQSAVLPVPGSFTKPAVHSYWYIRIDVETEILEGVGENSEGDLTWFGGYLNAKISPEGYINQDDPAKNPIEYDAANAGLNARQICDAATALLNAAKDYIANHNFSVKYDVLGFIHPNSNSFARYLRTFTNLRGVKPNGGAVGWKHGVLGR